jgi:hypothetical protein
MYAKPRTESIIVQLNPDYVCTSPLTNRSVKEGDAMRRPFMCAGHVQQLEVRVLTQSDDDEV